MIASANASQTVTITGTGLSAALRAVFSATDSSGNPATVERPLTNVSADGTEALATVAPEAVSGPVRLRPDGGDVYPVEALLQVVPTLASIQVAGGQPLRPGVRATLTGSGFRYGATHVVFTGAPPVVPETVMSGVLILVVPDGITAGSVHVVTDGGTSRDLPLPGTFGVVAVAAQGTPASSTEASANIGQTVSVSGTGLSAEWSLVFPAVDDDGQAFFVEAPLGGVGGDGTSATVMVPARAVSGPVRLRHSSGVLSDASVLLQVVPALASLSVPAGQRVEPGVELTLRGSGFSEGTTLGGLPRRGPGGRRRHPQSGRNAHGAYPGRRGIGNAGGRHRWRNEQHAAPRVPIGRHAARGVGGHPGGWRHECARQHDGHNPVLGADQPVDRSRRYHRAFRRRRAGRGDAGAERDKHRRSAAVCCNS